MGVSQRGYDTEIFAKKILESEGFEVIFAPEEQKRKSQNLKNEAHVLSRKSNNVISTDIEKILCGYFNTIATCKGKLARHMGKAQMKPNE